MNDVEALEEFLGIVKAADPTALILSLKDCHSRQVSSIVVGNDDDGRLLRAFLAWPRHDLHHNFDPARRGEFSVGVHDHRYDLKLRCFFGRPVNRIYGRVEYPRGIRVRQLAFRSRILYGKEAIRIEGARHLMLRSQATIPDTQWLRLSATDLHTMAVPRGECAAWWVHEGRARRDETWLYNNEPVDTAGMYQTFQSAQHVVEHVQRFVDEARKRSAT